MGRGKPRGSGRGRGGSSRANARRDFSPGEGVSRLLLDDAESEKDDSDETSEDGSSGSDDTESDDEAVTINFQVAMWDVGMECTTCSIRLSKTDIYIFFIV